MYGVIIFILFLWKQGESLRIVDLQVPGHAAEEGSALLGCQYDLEGEDLYSVKWYKDGREFYRYVPSNKETTSFFPVPGVTVDVARSSSTVVALEQLTRGSSGLYRCEVSGEAPYFVTVYDEKEISIHLLPKPGPRITGLQTEYQIGDQLAVNCTSARSRPRAQIKWLLNGRRPPKEYLRGPWVRISRDRPDAHDTTVELSFTLTPQHFKGNGVMLQCQASIAPLYQNEVIHQIERVDVPIDANDDFAILPLNRDNFVISKKKTDGNSAMPDHGTQLNLSTWTLLTSFLVFLN